MNSKAMRSTVALAVVAGLSAAILPICPAEAQWIFLARKAIGRV